MTTEREASKHNPRRPIRSAEMVAWVRALACRDPDPPVVCPDTLAHAFVRPILRLLLRPWGLWRWLARKRAPGLYHLHFGRTLYIDDALRAGLRDGVRQLVLLGAGFDSRPYRMRDELRGVAIFEVDFPGTQEAKRKALAKHFGRVPEHVSFVPIDFESQSLGEVLSAAGYDPQCPTLFVWEGVSCFLSPAAVDDVVLFVRDSSPAGSRLVFDLVDRQAIEGDHSAFGAEALVRSCTRLGEPLRFGLRRSADHDQLPGWLEERGMSLLDASTAEDMQARYFQSDPERRMVGCYRMVTAEVSG